MASSSVRSSSSRLRPIVEACLAAGVLIGTAGERVLRLTPALTVSEEELDLGLNQLEEVLA